MKRKKSTPTKNCGSKNAKGKSRGKKGCPRPGANICKNCSYNEIRILNTGRATEDSAAGLYFSRNYNSLRLLIAELKVISSAYSKSAPVERPRASFVILAPDSFSILAI